MVEPINLRQFRKRKQRQEKEKKADSNRKLHGIPTALRKKAKAENNIEASKLDGQKLTSIKPDKGE
ncbi:MAG: DUF4169 family protein [Pseudomonadota bacterium]